MPRFPIRIPDLLISLACKTQYFRIRGPSPCPILPTYHYNDIFFVYTEITEEHSSDSYCVPEAKLNADNREEAVTQVCRRGSALVLSRGAKLSRAPCADKG